MQKREFRNIGKLVKTTRDTKGISQTQLSKELGYKNGQFVSNIERGICSIPFEKIPTLSTLLGLEPLVIKDAILKDYSTTIDSYIKNPVVDAPSRELPKVTVTTTVGGN
jgi:transcriptional regulator with XRE-family HTH domain